MASFHRYFVAALLALPTTVHTQDSFYWQTLPVGGSSSENHTDAQCAAPFIDANATGTLPINRPDYGLLSNNFSWTIAVSQPAGDAVQTTNMSLYFGTPASQDIRQGNLSYSACAIMFLDLPDNLIRRGQTDEGSCMQTFGEECVKALADQAGTTGFYLTNSFTDNYPNPGMSFD
jgi:hypothetical protein